LWPFHSFSLIFTQQIFSLSDKSGKKGSIMPLPFVSGVSDSAPKEDMSMTLRLLDNLAKVRPDIVGNLQLQSFNQGCVDTLYYNYGASTEAEYDQFKKICRSGTEKLGRLVTAAATDEEPDFVPNNSNQDFVSVEPMSYELDIEPTLGIVASCQGVATNSYYGLENFPHGWPGSDAFYWQEQSGMAVCSFEVPILDDDHLDILSCSLPVASRMTGLSYVPDHLLMGGSFMPRVDQAQVFPVSSESSVPENVLDYCQIIDQIPFYSTPSTPFGPDSPYQLLPYYPETNGSSVIPDQADPLYY